MHAHQHVLAVADLAAHQRDVRLVVDLILERVDPEVAVVGRHLRRRDALHERLGVHAVLDQIRDGHHQQPVPLREARQLRHARHRAVFVHHFADDAGRVRARRSAPDRPPPRSVRCAPARRRSGSAAGTCGRGARDPPGCVSGSIAASTVAARSAAEMPVLVRCFASIGDAEPGVEPRAVLRHHQRNLELVEPLRRHRQANQPAAVARHEVDRLGRDLLGGDRQIAFVLAILVVDDDDHLAGANRLDGVLDAGERRAVGLRDLEPRPALGLVRFGCQCVTSPGRTPVSVSPASSAARTTYLPTMSHSRLTRSRMPMRPRLVCSIV